VERWAVGRPGFFPKTSTLKDIDRNGNDGIGKPEPLKHGFQGYWSRRVTDEHRLIYKITDYELRIAACRYLYGN
jgi:toxin YoeB